ncbi:uncharacterized protein LOC142578968 isoform X2 [Dermacentor variabilis]|uniref:uncharacterized protein LOC142578968 isoform X2 n=1 Tax=Dermacentor variabilis TaxID=34621 RepID=UPI003F5C2484
MPIARRAWINWIVALQALAVAIVFACSRECLCVPIVTPSKGRTRFANISIHNNQPHRKPLPSVHKLNTSCLQDNSFCETLPGYPKELVTSVMTLRGAPFRSYFAEVDRDEALLDDLVPPSSEQRVRVPFGSDVDEAQVCDVRVEVRYPRFGVDKDGDMRLIVNDGGDFKQPVRVEVCSACTQMNIQPWDRALHQSLAVL